MLLLSGLVLADCPATDAQLQETAATALQARGEAFEPALSAVEAQLQCVTEPLPPSLAATLHYLAALRAFRARNLGIVVDHLQAAQLADGAVLDAVLIDGHALSDLAAEAHGRTRPERVVLTLQEGRYVRVDGRVATTRAAGLPAVIQILDPDGAIAWTDLVGGEDEPPFLLLAPPPPIPLYREVETWGVLGGLVLSGTAWGISLGTRAKMSRLAAESQVGGPHPEAESELERLSRRTNTWGYVGQASTVATAGFGVVLVVSRW